MKFFYNFVEIQKLNYLDRVYNYIKLFRLITQIKN